MRKRSIAVLIALLALALTSVAQRRRDPLNAQEVDQLRESRQDPDVRLKLYAKFLRERMASIEKLRSDPRFGAERAPQVHDLLEDVGSLVEEMDDNVDLYAKDRFDIRKPLKEVIQADTETQQKLQQMQDSAKNDPAFAEELEKHYKFVLQDTMEAVNSSLDGARETMGEQESMAKKKQLRKAE